MITIRYNAFETNSSSSHALVISIKQKTREEFDLIEPNSKGYIVVYGGEFEWGFEEYYDTMDKINVLATVARYSEDEKETLKLLTQVIKDVTYCTDVIYEWDIVEEDYDKYGIVKSLYCEYPSIDHESRNLYLDIFSKGKEYVKQFIFNGDNCFFTGNDNDYDKRGIDLAQLRRGGCKDCEIIRS